MKCGNSNEAIHKDVVIIGNGPSGITLSYMLSGNIPYVISNSHPDEFLSARLATVLNKSLIHEDLEYLSGGLEGRTTNPVSLLIDNLMHPCADIGLELEPLVEWRNDGYEFKKFGHHCDIKKTVHDYAKYDKRKKFIYRLSWKFRNLFLINETNRRGYNFLRSQKKMENEYKKQLLYLLTIHPFSDFRKYWELFMSVILLIQIYSVTLNLAVCNMKLGDNFLNSKQFFDFRTLIDIISLLDVLLSFFSGYCNEKDSTITLEPKRIIGHYFCSTFFIDLLCSVPTDVILYNYESVLEELEVKPELIFVLKFMSLVKLCRFVTIVRYINNIFEVSGVSYLIYRIFIVSISFITYIHIVSCVGMAWTAWENPWNQDLSNTMLMIKSYGPYVNNFTIMYIHFFYSSCLMVLNAGYRLVTFSNPSLIYAVHIWVVSKILFILTLSYFMELYIVSQSSSQKYTDMIGEIKDCMKHRHIPDFLKRRILAYYDVKYQNFYFQESEILNTVSGQLRQEIVMNTCRKLVENVVFFKTLPIALLIRIVSCLRYEIFLTNDVIAKAGTPGDSMYFIANGTVAVYTKNGKEISHVVLGKGPPGGSWNSMDPQILTLSLGSWMGLPGLPYKTRNCSETRVSAKNVAEYYKSFVEQMNLSKHFKNHTLVTSIKPYIDLKSKWVEKVNNDITKKAKLCSRLEAKETTKNRNSTCTFSNAINYLLSRHQRKHNRSEAAQKADVKKTKPPVNNEIAEESFIKILRKYSDSDKSINFSCDFDYNCDNCYCNKCKHNVFTPRVPNKSKVCDSSRSKWVVEVFDLKTKQCVTYTCNYLVLANGSSDLPNRLNISSYKSDPYWLLYDLRSLEIELDLQVQNEAAALDPVLVIGAGLSAADAIIATRARDIPVLHLFRNKSSNLSKQLPENMYPEYHKVHQMMKNESNYPLYTPLAEYALTNLDQENRMVTLTSGDGTEEKFKVSFVVVLIGSKPDMSFLPTNYNLAVKKNQPLDCKTNTVSINKMTHSINGYESLYALGPLAGDNFVRFLPGGALAVLCDLYKKYEL